MLGLFADYTVAIVSLASGPAWYPNHHTLFNIIAVRISSSISFIQVSYLPPQE